MTAAAVLFPLLAAALVGCGLLPDRLRKAVLPIAVLPALWLALAGSPGLVSDYILLGLSLQVDATVRPLLLISGLVGSLAGWLAQARIERHARGLSAFWMLTLAGMNMALLAGEVASFYLGYVTVSLAAWGLVIHRRDSDSWRAGRIYLVMSLIGEALIIAGLLTLAASVGNARFDELAALLTDNPAPGSVFWLLLAGFGIKLGIAPLHFWLPLAHGIAPAPASALLSGLLVKAGLLGWLRFLQPESWDAAGQAIMPLTLLGIACALIAALYALTQHRPKVILAYSTISQMGLLLAAFALTLQDAESRLLMLPVIGVLIVHHGLNKAALFLGAGYARPQRKLDMLLLALPAVSLAGLPLTTGFLAKYALKSALPEWAGTAVTWTALTTTLLIVHFLVQMHAQRREDSDSRAPHPAWPIMVAAALVVPWAWHLAAGLTVPLQASAYLEATWPVALGAVLMLGLKWLAPSHRVHLPAGDVVVWMEGLARGVSRRWPRHRPTRTSPPSSSARLQLAPLIAAGETWLRSLPAFGTVLLALSVLLWVFLLR